jgi:hypothetical protein
MKEISLSQGKVAKVSNHRFESLNQWKWHYHHGYAVRNVYAKKKYKTIFMHREILMPPEGMECDHINGDTLDNQDENLRPCTHAQNMGNKGAYTNNTNQYKGVYKRKNKNYWEAQIRVSGKKVYIGLFYNAIEAARAYNKAARELFGDFARLNPV